MPAPASGVGLELVDLVRIDAIRVPAPAHFLALAGEDPGGGVPGDTTKSGALNNPARPPPYPAPTRGGGYASSLGSADGLEHVPV
jgi:hypothetical protein